MNHRSFKARLAALSVVPAAVAAALRESRKSGLSMKLASALFLLVAACPAPATDKYDAQALREAKAVVDSTPRPTERITAGRTPLLSTLLFQQNCFDLLLQVVAASIEDIKLDPSVGDSLGLCVGPLQANKELTTFTSQLTEFWLFGSKSRQTNRALFWLFV